MKVISDIIVLSIGCVVLGVATNCAIYLFNLGYNLF